MDTSRSMNDREPTNQREVWRSSPGSVPSIDHTVSLRKPLLKQHTTIGITSPVEDDNETMATSLQLKLECAVCLEVYSESGSSAPRSLSCGHSFCTRCITELVKGNGLNCPKCHHYTLLPPQGVNNLPKNFAILEMMYSIGAKDTGATDTLPLTLNKAPLCVEHGDQLSSYCKEDQQLVCSSCLLYGPHKQHQSKLVKEAASDHRQTLIKLTPGVSEIVVSAKKANKDIETAIECVNDSSLRISDEIESHFMELIGVLESRKKQLKVDALHRSQNRVEALMEQKETISTRIEMAQQVHETCTQLLALNDNYNLLDRYPRLTEDIRQVFAKFPSFDPIGRDDLVFEYPKGSLEELEYQYVGHGNIKSGIGTVKRLICEPFHDGVRIYWQGHNYVDSIGITYALQMACKRREQEFVNIYRGGDTKCTWRCDANKQESDEHFFRVRVQTCEGVGEWSQCVSCKRTSPGFKWCKKWCNIKIEMDESQLEVWSHHASGRNWTSVAGDTILTEGQHYMEIEIKEVARHHIRRDWFTKLSLGVIHCNQESVKSITWQEHKYPVGQLPSYNSWAFLATSGLKIYQSLHAGEEEEYGGVCTLEVGDRLGMLIDFSMDGSACMSFFCNSRDLGIAFVNMPGPLLPVVSVCDRFCCCLRFPPPPYTKRNPRLTLLSSESTSLF